MPIIPRILLMIATLCTAYTRLLCITTHVYFQDLLETEISAHTEKMAWDALQEKPLDLDVNYLALPWCTLILKNKLATVPPIKLDGGFTFCGHEDYEKILPLLKKIGIDVVFVPFLKHGKQYDGITVAPFPVPARKSGPPAPVKDITYSFIGAPTHWVRNTLFTMKHPDDCYIVKRNGFHFFNRNSKQREKYETEYINVMTRSRFALCPHGNSPNSFRLWEALKAGAIPVIIADHIALPYANWESAVIVIPMQKEAIKNIPELIANITPEQEEHMRQQCLNIYEQLSGSNLVQFISNFYADETILWSH